LRKVLQNILLRKVLFFGSTFSQKVVFGSTFWEKVVKRLFLVQPFPKRLFLQYFSQKYFKSIYIK